MSISCQDLLLTLRCRPVEIVQVPIVPSDFFTCNPRDRRPVEQERGLAIGGLPELRRAEEQVVSESKCSLKVSVKSILLD